MNYLQIARSHEEVFRNVLRDLRDNRAQRPMGLYLPENLETDAGLEVIFEKYSLGMRYRRFTITDFTVNEGSATIAFEDVALLSGGGACLKYSVNGNAVEYVEDEYVFMS